MDKQKFEEWLSKVEQARVETEREIQELRKEREQMQVVIEQQQARFDKILEYYKQLEEAREAQLFQLYSNRIKREV